MAMPMAGTKDCLDGNAFSFERLVCWRVYGLLFAGHQPTG
jgi:hypothetical protein